MASFAGLLPELETADRTGSGVPYDAYGWNADARCLVAYDDQGNAVAPVTVWSAGPGKPGLLEPMGVHREHRGHGYGKAITVAAAAALHELGSSSAIVCTPGSGTNTGTVSTIFKNSDADPRLGVLVIDTRVRSPADGPSTKKFDLSETSWPA